MCEPLRCRYGRVAWDGLLRLVADLGGKGTEPSRRERPLVYKSVR